MSSVGKVSDKKGKKDKKSSQNNSNESMEMEKVIEEEVQNAINELIPNNNSMTIYVNNDNQTAKTDRYYTRDNSGAEVDQLAIAMAMSEWDEKERIKEEKEKEKIRAEEERAQRLRKIEINRKILNKKLIEIIDNSVINGRKISDDVIKIMGHLNCFERNSDSSIGDTKIIRKYDSYRNYHLNDISLMIIQMISVFRNSPNSYIENIIYYASDHLQNITEKCKSIRNMYTFNAEKHKADKNSEFSHKAIENELICVDIKGDGNCLWNSISFSLFGDYTYMESLRLITASTIIDNREHFEKYLDNQKSKFGYNHDLSYDQLVSAATELSVWGDELHILALSIALKRPIFSYGSLNGLIAFYGNINDYQHLKMTYESEDFPNHIRYIGDMCDENEDPICLYYNGQNHYSVVLPKRSGVKPLVPKLQLLEPIFNLKVDTQELIDLTSDDCPNCNNKVEEIQIDRNEWDKQEITTQLQINSNEITLKAEIKIWKIKYQMSETDNQNLIEINQKLNDENTKLRKQLLELKDEKYKTDLFKQKPIESYSNAVKHSDRNGTKYSSSISQDCSKSKNLFTENDYKQIGFKPYVYDNSEQNVNNNNNNNNNCKERSISNINVEITSGSINSISNSNYKNNEYKSKQTGNNVTGARKYAYIDNSPGSQEPDSELPASYSSDDSMDVDECAGASNENTAATKQTNESNQNCPGQSTSELSIRECFKCKQPLKTSEHWMCDKCLKLTISTRV